VVANKEWLAPVVWLERLGRLEQLVWEARMVTLELQGLTAYRESQEQQVNRELQVLLALAVNRVWLVLLGLLV
jgi:hypothetical protein